MKSFFSRHGIFFLILICATVLRFHDISRQMIFIGDQGRDFRVAREMITTGNVPLLGIPSSIPRFAQGPLYIYFLGAVYWLTDGSVLATGLLAALFGVSAIIALYLLVGSYAGWRRGTLAALMLSLFPMAILHSRMPYHINPIPLFTCIFIWQLLRLSEKKSFAFFTVGLSFALLFQFELAVFPLFFLIPLALFLRHHPFDLLTGNAKENLSTEHLWSMIPVRRDVLTLLLGLGIGLLPQIIHDLTHRFSQLGGFGVWIIYRLVTTLLPFTRNTILEAETPARILELHKMYLTIFTQNQFLPDQIFWSLLIPVCILIIVIRRRQARPIETIAVFGFSILAASFMLHRVASEAYMPLLIPFALILLGAALEKLKQSVRYSLIGFIVLSLFFSVYRLEQSSFFLLNPQEAFTSAKRFGPSIQTQYQIVNTLYKLAQGRCVILQSEERKRTFPTSLDHLEYLLLIDRGAHPGPCVQILVDTPTSAQAYWDNPADIIDVGAYWLQVLDPQKLYAKHTAL